MSPPAKSAPAGEREAFYEGLIRDYAGVSETNDDVWVVGLRGVSTDGKRHDSDETVGGYNDTLVVLGSEEGAVTEFKAATHPGEARSADALWGVAHLRPGQYVAEPIESSSGRDEAGWRLRTPDGAASLPAWIDRDSNGKISPDEKEFDDHYGTCTKDVVVRNGMDSTRPTCVGGQTLPPREYERFVAAVGARRRFRYLLLDADHPVKLEVRDLRKLANPLSPVDDFGFYEKLALKKGVAPGFPVLVVLLRGLAPDGRRHASEDNIGPYNDSYVVLQRYDDGKTSTRVFRGSAHAGQRSTTRSPGVYAGIAQVRPGLYYARSNDNYHGMWSWHIVRHEDDYDGTVPAWRDRDKDGVLSAGEKQAAERARVTADEILIHNGIDANVGNSVGCLTLPPATMRAFIDHVGRDSFPLLLLDANAEP